MVILDHATKAIQNGVFVLFFQTKACFIKKNGFKETQEGCFF